MIQLVESVGKSTIDNYICGLIGLFEAKFPKRIIAYYLVGSVATGEEIQTSDVDVFAIFKNSFADGEKASIEQFRNDCQLISALPLDLPILCEADFYLGKRDPIALKTVSLFLFGTDIRANIPTPSIGDYTRLLTGAPYRNIVQRLRKQQVATFPLSYPASSDEFYGYAVGGNMQQFVVMVGWAASAIITIERKIYIPKKTKWLAIYQDLINDPWTLFLANVYELCRNKWCYQIPADEQERSVLRDICRSALDFENHYLSVYRTYFLRELSADDETSQQFALDQLATIIYHDDEVRYKVLEKMKESSASIKGAAKITFDAIQYGAGFNV